MSNILLFSGLITGMDYSDIISCKVKAKKYESYVNYHASGEGVYSSIEVTIGSYFSRAVLIREYEEKTAKIPIKIDTIEPHNVECSDSLLTNKFKDFLKKSNFVKKP